MKFPELKELRNKTLETTALKLLEEAGELASELTRFELNIEKTVLELIDCMQVCWSMAYILEEKHDVNIQEYFDKHIEKLKYRGYIK